MLLFIIFVFIIQCQNQSYNLLSSVGETVARFALGIVVVAVCAGRAVLGPLEGRLALALAGLGRAVAGVAGVFVALASWKNLKRVRN